MTFSHSINCHACCWTCMVVQRETKQSNNRAGRQELLRRVRKYRRDIGPICLLYTYISCRENKHEQRRLRGSWRRNRRPSRSHQVKLPFQEDQTGKPPSLNSLDQASREPGCKNVWWDRVSECQSDGLANCLRLIELVQRRMTKGEWQLQR